ncbi:hypothetical protein [uncultured Microscilla sp.]|uniref:hypothetical protein n=1 Tax=uncultured Microscilla sp. TaxID=432653 RepID=UPI0026176059|nr:hypothetical protein [uncultured Microscilla sp.]
MKYLHTLVCCALLLGLVACKTQGKNEALRCYSVLSTLEHQLKISYSLSDQMLFNLKKSVKKGGNTRKGLKRIKRAELLKLKTADLMGAIEKIKQHLINDAGGGLNDETAMPQQPLNVNNTQSIIHKAAPKLSHLIDKYVQWLSAEHKDLDLLTFPPLHEGSQGQSFYETFFEGAHLGKVLTTLTSTQGKIMRYQAEVMMKLGEGLY